MEMAMTMPVPLPRRLGLPALFVHCVQARWAKMLAFSSKRKVSTCKVFAAGVLAERAIGVYGDDILRLAYSYMRNLADAEDVLQDTLMTLVEKRPVFQDAGHEKAWLLTVASNVSKNRLRAGKLRQHDQLSESLVAGEREDLAFVWDAVGQLPVSHREVVHLYYHDGYTAEEIAQITNSNASTVRSNLKRGREKLRGILKEAYDFD